MKESVSDTDYSDIGEQPPPAKKKAKVSGKKSDKTPNDASKSKFQ